MSENTEDIKTRIRRMRALVCPNSKYEDEVERCPCTRGGRDVDGDSGHQTGCKDLMDALNAIDETDEE